MDKCKHKKKMHSDGYQSIIKDATEYNNINGKLNAYIVNFSNGLAITDPLEKFKSIIYKVFYKFRIQHNISDNLCEAIAQCSYIDWCKQIFYDVYQQYDPTKGKHFINYLYYQMLIRYIRNINKYNWRKKIAHFIPLSSLQNATEDYQKEYQLAELRNAVEIDISQIDIQTWITSLSKKQQRILLLRYQGLSIKEIASILNIHERTVIRILNMIKAEYIHTFSITNEEAKKYTRNYIYSESQC